MIDHRRLSWAPISRSKADLRPKRACGSGREERHAVGVVGVAAVARAVMDVGVGVRGRARKDAVGLQLAAAVGSHSAVAHVPRLKLS